jgi:uncharacterized protein (TIGR00156 family)
MKMNKTFAAFILAALFAIAAAHGQGGFTGPGGRANSRGPRTVTVNQARLLPDDSIVILTGKIVVAMGDEWYKFRDETGEILVEIDRRVWRGLTVGENDRIEITGKLDGGWGHAIVDVKSVRKIE